MAIATKFLQYDGLLLYSTFIYSKCRDTRFFCFFFVVRICAFILSFLNHGFLVFFFVFLGLQTDCSVHVTGGNTVGAGCFSNVIQPQQYYGMSNWMAFLNIEALNNDGMYLQREINNFDGITFMDPVRPTCGFTLLSTSFGFCLSVSVVVHVSSFLIALAFVIVL